MRLALPTAPQTRRRTTRPWQPRWGRWRTGSRPPRGATHCRGPGWEGSHSGSNTCDLFWLQTRSQCERVVQDDNTAAVRMKNVNVREKPNALLLFAAGAPCAPGCERPMFTNGIGATHTTRRSELLHGGERSSTRWNRAAVHKWWWGYTHDH
jgi:hypothetical protein